MKELQDVATEAVSKVPPRARADAATAAARSARTRQIRRQQLSV